MENLISVDTLKNSLGPDMFNTLSDQAIDAGSSFLAGQATSAFTKVMNVSSVKSVTNLATSAMGTAFIVKEALDPNMLKQLTTGLITTAVTTVSSAATEIISRETSKLTQKVTNIPQSIVSYAMSYFNSYKKSLGEVLKELMMGSEKLAEQESEQSDKKKENNFINNVKEKISYVNEKVTYYTDKVTPVVEMIASYTANGPDWIADKMNKEVNALIEDVDKFIVQQTDSINKGIDDFCRKTGEKKGEKMVKAYNDKLDKQAKKQQAKINTLKSKALTKAKALLQEGLLKVMALTGINIPIPL